MHPILSKPNAKLGLTLISRPALSIFSRVFCRNGNQKCHIWIFQINAFVEAKWKGIGSTIKESERYRPLTLAVTSGSMDNKVKWEHSFHFSVEISAGRKKDRDYGVLLRFLHRDSSIIFSSWQLKGVCEGDTQASRQNKETRRKE